MQAKALTLSVSSPRSQSDTARIRPSFDPKWCMTSAGDTPAVLAVSRIVSDCGPSRAMSRIAVALIRAFLVKSRSSICFTVLPPHAGRF